MMGKIPFTTIWERYFLREILKCFSLFLLCFYGLYLLIDYAGHVSILIGGRFFTYWKELAFYYGYEFIKRIDLLIPLGVLIATIKTLCSLNKNNELLALMAGQIPLRRLLRPFIFVGLFFTLLIYLNEQFLFPKASLSTKWADELHKREKYRKKEAPPAVQSLYLKDNSILLFHSYDPSQEAFLGVYWIRSFDEIYRMKSLYPYLAQPEGEQVIKLNRGETGRFVATENYLIKAFPEINIEPSQLNEVALSVEDFSLTELWYKFPHSQQLSEKEATILATLYHRLAMPWLSFLVVIGVIPFCIIHKRQSHSFFIYVISIFALISFYLFLDAAFILGKRQIFSPLMAVLVPFSCFALLCSVLYRKSLCS